jgi:hypothetical protein
MPPHLAEPPDRLEGFPQRLLPAGSELWLVHAADRWPWVCSCGDDARFNLDAPWGACHLAVEPLGALVESCCREEPVVDAEAVETQRVSRMRIGRELRLADFADARACGFGVTAEIHSSPDYALTQRWARAAHRAGFDGVHYLVRHDPSQRLSAVALFGPAGERRDWPPPSTQPLSAALLDEAQERLGVTVRAAARRAGAR